MSKMKQNKSSKKKKESKTDSSHQNKNPKKNKNEKKTVEKREAIEEDFTATAAITTNTTTHEDMFDNDSNVVVSNISSSVTNVGSSNVDDKKETFVSTSNVDDMVHSILRSNKNCSTTTSKWDSGNFENVLTNASVVEISDVDSDGEENSSSQSLSTNKQNILEIFAFVYNFLRDQYFYDSMAAFEKEYAEKFEDVEILKTKKCRNVFAQNTLLRNEIQTQIKFKNDAENCLRKAQMEITQLKKERDNHSMRHNRAEQEKATLYKDLQRQKNEMKKLQKTLEAQKSKYEVLRKEKVMIMLEKDKCSSKIEGMNNYINRLKQLLGCNDENESGETSTAQGDAGSGRSEQGRSQGQRLGRNEQSTEDSSVANNKIEDTPWPNDNDNESEYDFPIQPVNSEESTGLTSVDHLKDVVHFTGHNSAVAGMDYSFKMNLLATGSDDGTWKTWTGTDGELVMASPNQNNWLGSVCFHPNGNLLCTAGGDSKVKIWNLEKEMCIYTFKHHTGPVWNLSFHREGNFLASCSMDQTVRIFDMNSLKQRQILRGHTDSVNSVKFHPSSNLLVTASVDRTVSIWDMRSGLCKNTFYGHDFPCNDVSYNCITNWLISCDCGGIVKIWDIRSNQCLLSLDVGPVSANKCATDMVGEYLYIASDDTMLKIFDFQKKRFVQSFYHKAPVKSVVVGIDSIYTGLGNGDMHIWGS